MFINIVVGPPIGWKAKNTKQCNYKIRLSNRLDLFQILGSLRKQPSFFAPGPSGISRETPLGRGAKKNGCLCRLDFRIPSPQTRPNKEDFFAK